MMKILVVYFSRTGHTRRLAERLARELDATPMAIAETGSRLGFLGYWRSLFEAVAGRGAEIEKARRDPAEFDLVVVGTPIWGWNLSSPVRAFMRSHARSMPRAAFFCTMGGSGDRVAFEELQRLLGRAPEATLALTQAEVAHLGRADVKAKIARFVAPLRAPEKRAVAKAA